MSASVRQAFVDKLKSELERRLEVTFEDGPIDGPQLDRDIGCVWWEGTRPWSRDGNEAENFYRVRLLRRHLVDQGAATPRDEVARRLLTDAEDLEDALRDLLTTAGHQFFNVAEVTPDYQRQHVDAQLTAYDRNRAARGG